MAKVIFKYPVQIADEFIIDMPQGAEILTVQAQNGLPYIWALVDDTALLKPYQFAVIGTGNPMPSYPVGYLGTVRLGPFVWHIFEMV